MAFSRLDRCPPEVPLTVSQTNPCWAPGQRINPPGDERLAVGKHCTPIRGLNNTMNPHPFADADSGGCEGLSDIQNWLRDWCRLVHWHTTSIVAVVMEYIQYRMEVAQPHAEPIPLQQ
jgi:hypothetical protein